MSQTQRVGRLSVLLLAAVLACQSSVLTGAKVYLQNGEYEKALEAAQRASSQEPDNPETFFVVGVAYSYLDSVAPAYEAFMRSLALDPQDTKRARWVDDNIAHNFTRHYQSGRSAFERGNYAESVRELTKATQADPRDPRAFYDLGTAYTEIASADSSAGPLAAGAFENALALMDDANPLYARTQEGLGRNLIAAGRFEEAAARFREVLARDPTRADAVAAVAQDLLAAQRWRGAAAVLEAVVDAQKAAAGESYATHYNLALAYSRLRDVEPDAVTSAIQHLRAAHELKPDEPDAVMSLMALAMWRADWSQAIEWGEKYIKLSSDHTQAWRLLARCYSEAGDKSKARDCLTRAQALTE